MASRVCPDMEVADVCVKTGKVCQGANGGQARVVRDRGGRFGEEWEQRNTRRYLALPHQLTRVELHLLLGNHQMEVVEKEELELELVELRQRKAANL